MASKLTVNSKRKYFREEEERERLEQYRKEGKSATECARIFEVPVSAVYNTWEAMGLTGNRPRTGFQKVTVESVFQDPLVEVVEITKEILQLQKRLRGMLK